MIILLSFILLGLVAGVASGLLGIGGGIIIVPMLTFIFGLTQQQAQGTTLALLSFPVAILGAWTYYKQGYVDMKITALLCIGFFLGSLFGARFAVNLPTELLTKIFGVLLILIGIRMVM